MKLTSSTTELDLLDRKEAAELLGTSLQYLANLASADMKREKNGEAPLGPPYVKVGKNAKYRRSDLLKWHDRRSQETRRGSRDLGTPAAGAASVATSSAPATLPAATPDRGPVVCFAAVELFGSDMGESEVTLRRRADGKIEIVRVLNLR